jgi:hypothetical protein
MLYFVMLNFKNYKTTKKQGDVGVAIASMFATLQDYTVSHPFSDSQSYDIVFDIKGSLKKVSVKTTSQLARRVSKKTYLVQLYTSGGTKGTDITYFDPKAVDFVFVACDNGDCYFIPSNIITTRTDLTLSSSLEEYKVFTLNLLGHKPF